MGIPAAASPYQATTREAVRPSAARHPGRDILPAGYWLCVARAPSGQVLVDTLGLPLSIEVTPAGVHDKVGAWRLLAGLTPLVPRLAKLWADGAYTSGKLARWCERYGGWGLESVGRDLGTQGFAVQPRRWVVEPGALGAGFAWLVRNRRLRVDYERQVQTSEARIEVATIRILRQRLAKAT